MAYELHLPFRTHLVISIESPSGSLTHAEEDTLEALLTQIDTLLISFVGVGHLEDVPSCKQQCLLFPYILKYFLPAVLPFFLSSSLQLTKQTLQTQINLSSHLRGSLKVPARLLLL